MGALFALAVFAIIVSGGRPSGIVERGPFTSDFFDEQAHALLEGHLDVDPEVAGIEGFERDGRTYLYFGLVPALLRLPVAVVTDGADGRLTQLSMVLALAVALSATTRLLWRARRWHRGGDLAVRRWEPPVVGCFVAGVGLASPLLFLAARPVAYHEVELWGTATTLVAFDALLRWWDAPDRLRPLAVASLSALVAFNTRASVGGGSVAALALVAGLALLWGRVPWRRLPLVTLAVAAPVVVYASVNLARFDSPFTVPFEDQVFTKLNEPRQAALEATDNTMFGPEFAPTALATYLRPDGIAVQRLFPWFTFRESTTVIGDPTFDTIDRAASLPVVAPTFLVLAGFGVVATVRRRARDPWLAVIAAGAIGLGSTVTIAFIANRYLADFVPSLVVAASLGLWVVADRLAGSTPARRRSVVIPLAGMTALACLVSLALAIQAQRLFILPTAEDRRGFVSLQHELDDALRAGPPPSVNRVDRVGAPGPRGDVVIVGDCDGLYWSDRERWWPLELSGDLGRVLQGTFPRGRTNLVRSAQWSLVAEVTGTAVRFRYENDDGTVRQGRSIRLGDEVDHRVLVTLDPVGSEVVVELDGDEALREWLVDVGGAAQVDPRWRVSANPAPLCRELDGRLDG